MRYSAPSKEEQQIFNREWKRAKRICKPFLDDKLKPRFYTMNTLWRLSDGQAIGIHFGRDGSMMKINGAWSSAHTIVLRKDLSPEQFIRTIRHEIIHCVHQNHKRGFKLLLAGLNRDIEKVSEETSPTALA